MQGSMSRDAFITSVTWASRLILQRKRTGNAGELSVLRGAVPTRLIQTMVGHISFSESGGLSEPIRTRYELCGASTRTKIPASYF